MNDIKKIPQKKPTDLFKTELPQPALKKVELKPEKPIRVDVGFWEALWLLIKSVVRNKARDAMEGKPVTSDQLSVISFLTGNWWKLGVGLGVLLLLIWICTE